MLRKIILSGLIVLISLAVIGQAAAEGGFGGAPGISSRAGGIFGTNGQLGLGFNSFGPGFGSPLMPVSAFGHYCMSGPYDYILSHTASPCSHPMDIIANCLSRKTGLRSIFRQIRDILLSPWAWLFIISLATKAIFHVPQTMLPRLQARTCLL